MGTSAVIIRKFLPALLLLAIIRGAKAESPTINFITPSAIAPGKTTEIIFRGSNLDHLTSVWTSFPCQIMFATDTNPSNTAICRLTLPKNTRLGMGAVRLSTTHGISSLHFIMIDDLPTAPENGINKTIASAPRLTMPVAIDGFCEPLTNRYFKFSAKNHQRIAVDVVAQRLGSRLDPLVRLLDTSGRELVWCDDDPAGGADSRFAYEIKADGDYLLEIRDTNYEGGPSYRYRLRVGDFALQNFGYLTSVKPNPHGKLPETIEAEQNDTPVAASMVVIPGAINGRFNQPKDRDYFSFEAKKGARFMFTAQTRTLGSPCDAFMRVSKLDGTFLSPAKTSSADEEILEIAIPEDGTYLLVVEELNRRGGPEMTYLINVEPAQPGFTLTVDEEKIDARAGGAFQIKVNCVRRDYKGPIELSIDGAKFEIENNIIPAEKKEAVLKVKIPPELRPGTMTHFTISGRAKIGNADFVTTASTTPALKKLFPAILYPPIELDGTIALGVMEKKQ